MIIIPYHEEKQETHSECNYFGTDVASCVRIHPTATPQQPHTFTRKVCHTGAQKVYYRSNSKTFTDKLIIEGIWNVRSVSLAKDVTVVSIVKPTSCTNVSNLFYFGMTIYMFRTIFPSNIKSYRLYIQQQSFVKQILLYVQSWTPDDGRKDRPKHVECHSKMK